MTKKSFKYLLSVCDAEPPRATGHIAVEPILSEFHAFYSDSLSQHLIWGFGLEVNVAQLCLLLCSLFRSLSVEAAWPLPQG